MSAAETIERPDVDKVLAPLKDFQRDTVDHVFRRLFTDSDRTHRFLVADEVGLGKTLIARGIIARAVDRYWDTVERIDVVYICSNGDIARQNVNRMNITGRKEWALASRVTLLPKQLHYIKGRKVNFIAFTPATTFHLASSGGKQDERVLMYWLLKSEWDLQGKGALNLLQGWVQDHERFRYSIDRFRRKDKIEPSLQEAFHKALRARDALNRQAGAPTLRSRFDTLCADFARARIHISKGERKEQSQMIGDLRSLLASTCIRALEPDLVILDEFQRFKDLLQVSESSEEEPEELQLARELFDYAHGDEKTRILLLSATPYKMYTTSDEAATDQHYEDFRLTLAFLHDNAGKTQRVADLLERYRTAMYRLAEGRSELLELRAALEFELRSVMVRTERLAATTNRNGMLREVRDTVPQLQSEDALTYREFQRVAKAADQPDTIELWKSTPYPLSFMDDYVLKKKVQKALSGDEDTRPVADAVLSSRELFLPRGMLRGRSPLAPPHPRLRWLVDSCLAQNLWRLLWIPSSLPRYRPRGAFESSNGRQPTKQLIFSAWRVVPKAIAALVSYEVERRMLEPIATGTESLDEVRARQVALLRFNRSGGRLTGMPVVGLVYPSIYLAELGEKVLDAVHKSSIPTADDLLRTLRQQIAEDLDRLGAGRRTSGAADESWYWAAPVLLDLEANPRARDWLTRSDIARRWSGLDEEMKSSEEGEDDNAGENGDRSAWADHVAQVQQALSRSSLGPQPADLADVLAELALGGPAICALRALTRTVATADRARDDLARDASGQIAWAFRNLFNLPEVLALLRSLNAAEPYWRRVLEYCVDGNLQAVLDEYVHVLREALGLFDDKAEDAVAEIVQKIREALGLRTAAVVVDRLTKSGRLEKERMRARFAVRFGDEAEVEGKGANRKDAVRTAFNSPFWPFVLATTSVGQEGLDFHLYCHSVIHWNLPSNPVDLEQREGRVHRFKGHAVRKNVASVHAGADPSRHDRWEAAFDDALAKRSSDASDIVPYWVFPVEGGASIERHVPALPLSRDEVRLRRLKRSLVVYRMVFGQPRQEELVEFLLSQLPPDQVTQRLEELRIDLSPQRISV